MGTATAWVSSLEYFVVVYDLEICGAHSAVNGEELFLATLYSVTSFTVKNEFTR